MFCLIQFNSIHLSSYFITSNYQNHNDILLIILLNCHKIIIKIIYVMLLDLYIYLYMYICRYVYKYINIIVSIVLISSNNR